MQPILPEEPGLHLIETPAPHRPNTWTGRLREEWDVAWKTAILGIPVVIVGLTGGTAVGTGIYIGLRLLGWVP